MTTDTTLSGPPRSHFPPPVVPEPSPGGTSDRAEPASPLRVIGALCAAAAIQVGAILTALASLLIWLLATTESLFQTRDEPLWWHSLAYPVLALAVVLWIVSGAVAARIMRARTGWLALLLLPTVTTGLSSVAALF